MKKLFAIFVVILFISGLMVCFLLGADDTGSIDTTLFEGTTNNIYQEDKTDINISDDDGPFEQTTISEESVNTSNADVIEEQEEEQIQSITDFNDEFDLYDTWIEAKYSEFIPNDTVAEANTEDYSYKIHENGYVEIISYIGTDSMVTIPACIEECTVVYIGESAFESSNITSVTIPETVMYISDFAFADCKNLKSVDLSRNLLAIGSHAFWNCTDLESILLPDKIEYLGTGCFSECVKLSNILIPSSLLELDDFCFMECHSLKTVEFENGIQYIHCQAFSETAIEKIILPSSLVEIENSCFMRCENLSEVIFPVHMDNSLIIGASNFMDCKALKKIELPDNVVLIGSEAFYGCHNLNSIVIPESVETIGDFAFANCNTLSDIYFESADCDIGIPGFRAITFNPIKIHAPKGGSVEKYGKETLGVEFYEHNQS